MTLDVFSCMQNSWEVYEDFNFCRIETEVLFGAPLAESRTLSRTLMARPMNSALRKCFWLKFYETEADHVDKCCPNRTCR